MLILVSMLVISILASSHMLTVTPTKSQDVKGTVTSPTPTKVAFKTKVEESAATAPTVKIEITHTPKQNQQTTDISFVYPNSISLGGSVYESSDDPKTITAWYKEKINSENMNVTSFITTNTNDTVKNVLAFANNQKNMQIEITKNPADTKTKIKIQ